MTWIPAYAGMTGVGNGNDGGEKTGMTGREGNGSPGLTAQAVYPGSHCIGHHCLYAACDSGGARASSTRVFGADTSRPNNISVMRVDAPS